MLFFIKADLLNRLPLSSHLHWDVVPLIPAERAPESAKWAMQQLSPAQRRQDVARLRIRVPLSCPRTVWGWPAETTVRRVGWFRLGR